MSKLINAKMPQKKAQYLAVLEAASKAYELPAHLILSKTRVYDVVCARHTIALYLSKVANWSEKEIAKELNKDRTTVWHSIKTGRDLLLTNPIFANRFETVCVDARPRSIETGTTSNKFKPQLEKLIASMEELATKFVQLRKDLEAINRNMHYY